MQFHNQVFHLSCRRHGRSSLKVVQTRQKSKFANTLKLLVCLVHHWGWVTSIKPTWLHLKLNWFVLQLCMSCQSHRLSYCTGYISLRIPILPACFRRFSWQPISDLWRHKSEFMGTKLAQTALSPVKLPLPFPWPLVSFSPGRLADFSVRNVLLNLVASSAFVETSTILIKTFWLNGWIPKTVLGGFFFNSLFTYKTLHVLERFLISITLTAMSVQQIVQPHQCPTTATKISLYLDHLECLEPPQLETVRSDCIPSLKLT